MWYCSLYVVENRIPTNITHAVELSYEHRTQTHNTTFLHKIIEIDKKNVGHLGFKYGHHIFCNCILSPIHRTKIIHK